MADILIFDDDPSIGDLTTELLRSRGLTVDHYRSGAGIVQMVQQARPSLVVIDIMMPGMDGFSACRAIRSNLSTRSVKIIVMTAKTSPEDEDMARRCGANMFLHKPFDPTAFATAIGIVLKIPMGNKIKPPPGAAQVAVTILPSSAVLRTENLWILFDAGRGLRDWLRTQGPPPQICCVLLSRYQEECIAEIDAIGTLLAAGSRVHLAGPDDPEATLHLLGPRIARGGVKKLPHLYSSREGEFLLAPGVPAMTQYTHHPGPTLAYRIHVNGRRVTYCPAHNIQRGGSVDWTGYEMNKFRAFFAHANLLLHGYRRSEADPVSQDGHGQCAWEPLVDFAAECQLDELALIALPGVVKPKDLQARIEDRIKKNDPSLVCTAARSGQIFSL